MTDQLQLDLAVRSAESADRTAKPLIGQLLVLPGSTWRDIFGPVAQEADADAPISRSNSQEGAA